MDPFRKQRDLEGAAAATSKHAKISPGANPPPYREARLPDSIIARNMAHNARPTKPPKAITADQILGTDKASFLRGIVPQSCR